MEQGISTRLTELIDKYDIDPLTFVNIVLANKLTIVDMHDIIYVEQKIIDYIEANK